MKKPSPIKEGVEPLGQRLRRIRRASGLTLAGVSTLTGLNFSHICLLERSDRDPQTSTFAALAAAYDMTMDEVWYGTGKATPPLAGSLAAPYRRAVNAVS